MPLLPLLLLLLSSLIESKQRGGSNLVRNFPTTMPKSIHGYLQAKPASDATLVLRRDVTAVESDGGVLVKSLIWEYDGVPVLLVLPLDRLVDKAKLADHLCVTKDAVGLVDRERASHLAGYQIGTIPPCGLRCPLRTIVDAALASEHRHHIYAGSGDVTQQLKITLSELLRLSNGELAEISVTLGDNNLFPGAKPVHQTLRSITRLRGNSPPPPPIPPLHNNEDTEGNVQISDTVDTSAVILDRPDKAADKLMTEKQTLNKQARKIAWEAQKRQKETEEASAGFTIKALRDQAVYPDNRKFFDLIALFDQANISNRHVLDEATPSGKTALHLAAWKGSVEAVYALLERGADINKYSTSPGNYGKTAIFYAITRRLVNPLHPRFLICPRSSFPTLTTIFSTFTIKTGVAMTGNYYAMSMHNGYCYLYVIPIPVVMMW